MNVVSLNQTPGHIHTQAMHLAAASLAHSIMHIFAHTAYYFDPT